MSSAERLIYLPLGGAGEVGMNAYVYGWGAPGKERLILVDLGVTFGDMDGSPGVDLIFPDLSWLIERADRLEAVIITHGHEDHIGALGHFWSKLRVPVYTRKFTGALAARKLDDQGGDPDAVEVLEPFPHSEQVGPFGISFVPISHSIPESSAVILDTPAGRLVHTGDFKLDPQPIVGEPWDPALWAEVAKPGIHALVCDSTNVAVPHPGRSESEISAAITKLIAEQPGMVVATTFASNVARLKTLAQAADAAGRSVCLLGRAMRRMVSVAVETGVLTDFPTTVGPEDAAAIPRENLMLLATGSQGERRAATAQLARGKFLGLEMKAGDTFLFSSKTIPGNERDVLRIVNAFSEKDIEVIDDSTGDYHVSGHANGPDLEEMHRVTNPRMVIPMHGEHRMLRKHAKLAQATGRASAIATNGTMLDLTGAAPAVAEYVETGRIYLDGTAKIGALDGVVRDRIRMALNGHVLVTLILDEDDELLGEPWAELKGLPETGSSNASLAELIEADVDQLVARSTAKVITDDDKLDEAVRRTVRQTCMSEIGKKPEVTCVISRLA
ncbi:MAG: ribonuclease J [Oceanicola sp.]|nr:ribonuclease J [Oceanicola sp.]